MTRFCERCQRITVDGNLWCPEVDCPAEERFPVLVYGDFLGDLKITKLMRVWRTAALYEALRGEQKVMVKVAHESEDSEERLKREAAAFQSFQHRGWSPFGWLRSFLPSERPLLPELLPPYPVAAKRPYGEISFRGDTKFYSVFKLAEGKFLSDLMLENPQMWHYDAAWIAITLSEALRPMAAQNRCHLCLTPDMVLVDRDQEGHLRPMLLDLGLIVAGEEIQSIYDWPRMVEPAYTAPELLDRARVKTVTPAADAYALGMLYYELLAGKAGFEHDLRRDDQIRAAVMQNRGSLPVGRPELELAGVVKAVDRAVAPSSRYNNVVEVGAALAAIYGWPPREKRAMPLKGALAIPLAIVLSLVALGSVAYILIQLLPRLLTGAP
jgi:serine/threonine protein kinase